MTIKIASFGKHFGEEPVLVGRGGAGTIFFTGCNLKCVFCQNYQISQQGIFQKEYSANETAEIMLGLQKEGAVNIDLVSPTIWASQIKEAIKIAKDGGLAIPTVWNSNAYESERLLEQLEGLVDIYLPDFKYGDDEIAKKYSNASNYSKIAEGAIREMLRQVGNLKIEQGVAKRGVIVRHLVLSGLLENSFKALEILAKIDKNIFLSLMSQYHPLYRASQFPEINRSVSIKEFEKVVEFATKSGFTNGWIQGKESPKAFVPDFTKEKPFNQ